MPVRGRPTTLRSPAAAGPGWRLARLVAALVCLLTALPPVAPAARAAPAFVAVQGDQLVLDGRPVAIKGSNYYQRDAPWAEMWRQWNGPQVEQEVAEGARALGLNALRVLVPHGARFGWSDRETGAVDPAMLDRLRQMIQIAGRHDLRVIVTLFDFADDWPAAGTPGEAAHLRYLTDIVGAFRDDDRVLAWDLHNEPDFYAQWKRRGRADEVVDWLARMAAATRRLDPNHPITIGLGDYRNYWTDAGPGLPRLIDLVDVVSFHAYDASRVDLQAREIRGRTDKPVLIEEVGWPTGPPYRDAGYTEEVQRLVYERTLEAVRAERLAGAVQWLMWDLMAGRRIRPVADVDWMGLLRRDGTLKPAGAVFAAWAVPPLPASVATDLPLTGQPPTEAERPLFVPETGLLVPVPFKDRWQADGLALLGLPLTDPVDDQGRVVQFFERAVMEYAPEARDEPGFADLPPDEQARRLAPLRPLGRLLTADRAFPPIPPFAGGDRRRFFPETGHGLAGGFLAFWEGHGGAAQFGPPISEELDEVGADGQVHTVQYFERARFEEHPEFAGAPDEVQLGQLGREALRQRGWLP